MGFERWGYQFDGPYLNILMLDDRPGVYVVWCDKNDTLSILDVGESFSIRERFPSHRRESCWNKNCGGTIKYSVTYISDMAERLRLERTIRSSVAVPCGDRQGPNSWISNIEDIK